MAKHTTFEVSMVHKFVGSEIVHRIHLRKQAVTEIVFVDLHRCKVAQVIAFLVDIMYDLFSMKD